MTHNTVEVPMGRLKLPEFVEYHGVVYRAWKVLPVVKPGGFALQATDSAQNPVALLYMHANPIVLKVVG